MVQQLGRVLVEAGLLTEEELQAALARQKEDPTKRIGEIVVDMGLASEQDLAQTLAFQLNLPYVDLSIAEVDPKAIEHLPERIATQYHLLPLSLDGKTLTVAMEDPLDLEAIQAAQFASGYRVKPVVAEPSRIEEAIRRYYGLEDTVDDIIKNISHGGDMELIPDRISEEEVEDLRRRSEMTPVVRMVNLILFEAIQRGASDIHIEPQEKFVLIRNRIDGQLREVMQTPKWIQGALTSRIKIMANLDISVRHAPQDGKFRVRADDRDVDLRISTLPTRYGEKIVIRILDQSKAALTLEDIGLSHGPLNDLREMINASEGFMLITGPTGSGKTTTLYAIINEIKVKDLNIVTLEDPIEYNMEGVNQTQINEKAGLTFANGLRSILRQDPNVIMVGEIRDSETATIAFRAAITGHLVLSTLHTHDTASTVTRLLDLGVEPYMLGSSLLGVVAQRLIRMICPECRIEYEPDPETRARIESKLGEELSFILYQGKGCPSCGGTGYKGRIGVFEVMRIDSAIRELITQGASESEIRERALQSGMIPLVQDGLTKLKRGITTVEEVERVLFGEEEAQTCPHCGRNVEPGFIACPYCGTPLTDRCPSCGRRMEPDWTVCPFCGTERGRTPDKGPPPAPMVPPSSPDQLQGMKILVVDDDPEVRTSVSDVLHLEGFEVSTARDGVEALEQINRNTPHLVITDVVMPRMDGIELCRKLRKGISTAFIPVIMLSVRDKVEDRLAGYLVGTDDYLPKPYAIEELIAKVRAVLRRTYGLSDWGRQAPRLADRTLTPKEAHMAKTALIVDDARLARIVARKGVEMAGYRVIAEAKDGEEALKLFETHQPDLVTMDIVMPGMEGGEVLRKMRAIKPDARIIMLSSLGHQLLIKDALEAGASGFVQKPFKPADLAKAIQQIEH